MQVGKDGVTEGVLTALDEALLTHELVKIRIGQNAADDKNNTAQALATGTNSEVAQVLGNTLLLYRRNPDKPRILA